MDRVEKLAATITRLKAEDRERLFRILAQRGAWPPPAGRVSQQELISPLPQGNRRPDYVLVFDGGSKGNPGWGYGSYAIMRVQDGAQRVERLDFGEGYTNNEAEYDSLIAGLQDLLDRIEGAGRQPREFAVQVRGDSSLVIKQVLGQWKAKDARMRERRDRCRRLLGRFGNVELKLQPREESVRVLGH